jgi:hypothetical protein
MNEQAIYAMQLVESLESEYRTPQYEHRMAFMTGLRSFLRPDRTIRR